MDLNFNAIFRNTKTENNITSNEYDLLVGTTRVGNGILQTNIEYTSGRLGGIYIVNNKWILNFRYETSIDMGFYYVEAFQSILPPPKPDVSKAIVTYVTGRDAVNVSPNDIVSTLTTFDGINYTINIKQLFKEL